MKNFKKDLACNITLIFVLACTVTHLILLTLNLFRVTNFYLPEYFNYIVAYVLVAISLALYILGFFVTAKNGFDFPKWLRIMFYIAFFVFTNTYYLTGLFDNIFALIALFVYMSFCLSIISLSIFYNAQKDDKNRLKSTRKFIVTSTFMYSLALDFLLLILVAMIKAFFFAESATSTLLVLVIEACSMILVSIVLMICFNESLKRSKKFINSCLLKYSSPSLVKKSVKDA